VVVREISASAVDRGEEEHAQERHAPEQPGQRGYAAMAMSAHSRHHDFRR
jgi:hypothetical protein